MQHSFQMTDNGAMVNAQAGDTLLVELEENPTTGYTWALAEDSAGPWQMEESNYELYASGGIGGGGVRVFKFSLPQKGEGMLQLKNWQRWSGDTYQTFSLHVKVA